MYRPKGCKECGGKMQAGGPMPRQQDYPDYESWAAAMDAWHAQNTPAKQAPTIDMSKYLKVNDIDVMEPIDNTPTPSPMNRVQEGLAKGIITPPEGWQNWNSFVNTPQKPVAKHNPVNWQNVGIGIGQGLNLLSEISGRVERGRQNQYD